MLNDPMGDAVNLEAQAFYDAQNQARGGAGMPQSMMYAIASDEYNWETARSKLSTLGSIFSGGGSYGSFLSDLVANINANGISSSFRISGSQISKAYDDEIEISGKLLKEVKIRAGNISDDHLATQDIWRQVDADLHPSANSFWVDATAFREMSMQYG